MGEAPGKDLREASRDKGGPQGLDSASLKELRSRYLLKPLDKNPAGQYHDFISVKLRAEKPTQVSDPQKIINLCCFNLSDLYTFLWQCYRLNGIPQKSLVALTPKVTAFGDRAFEEVIKVNSGLKSGILTQ